MKLVCTGGPCDGRVIELIGHAEQVYLPYTKNVAAPAVVDLARYAMVAGELVFQDK